MIRVKGQFSLQFSIGGNSDVLASAENFITFRTMEQAGNLLPEFQLSCKVGKPQHLSLFNEGNRLSVTMGRDSGDALTSFFRMGKPTITAVDTSTWSIEVSGLYDAPHYLTGATCEILRAKSGAEALRTVLGRHFSVDSQINSSDTMNWINPGLSDKLFADDIWLHTHLPSSFPLVGITLDGKARVRDGRRLVGSGPKWYFVEHGGTGMSNTITMDCAPFASQNTAFFNQWLVHDRKQMILDMDKGTVDNYEQHITPLFSMSGTLDRMSGIESRAVPMAITNRNMHKNWSQAYQHNTASLIACSASNVLVSFSNKNYPISVLDLAMIRTPESETVQASNEHISGLYVVDNVSRTFTGMGLTTDVRLSRECWSQYRGSLA